MEELKRDLLKEDPSYKITILKADLVNISSTDIRNAIANGDDPAKWLM